MDYVTKVAVEEWSTSDLCIIKQMKMEIRQFEDKNLALYSYAIVTAVPQEAASLTPDYALEKD